MGGRFDRRERLTDRIAIGVLSRVIPRDLVDEVIAESGRREKRTRLLPAHVVVYYVLALGLFFGEGYEEVMRRLVGGLRFYGTGPVSGRYRRRALSPKRAHGLVRLQ